MLANQLRLSFKPQHGISRCGIQMFTSRSIPSRSLFTRLNELSLHEQQQHKRKKGAQQNTLPLLGLLGAACTLATFSTMPLHAKAAVPQNPLLGANFDKKVTLYQYEVCPYCNKVKAFLDFHGIPYEKVEVNPLSKEEIKFSDYKMVPFAVVEGTGQVNGSQQIIHTLSENALPGKVTENAESEKWEQWVDDWLVHLLPPNIYRTPSEALQAFQYITEQSKFSMWGKLSARYAGAAIMYMIAKRAKNKYGLGDDARQDLYDAVQRWTTEGLAGRQFHGGEMPDNADLAVFGVLRAIDGDVGSLRYDTWTDLKAYKSESMELFWDWYGSMQEITPPPTLTN